MRTIADRRRRIWVGPAALIVAAGLLGACRPILRFHNQRLRHSGVHPLTLLSEAMESRAGDGKPPVRSVVSAKPCVSVALLVLFASLVSMVLKMRRTAFVPIVVSRFKLPRAATDSDPSS